MRKNVVLLGLLGLMITLSSQAQKAVKKGSTPKSTVAPVAKHDPVVFSFGNDTVFKTEFVRQLNKNRKETKLPTEKELNDYLDLYINFKLKVKEAMNMHLDTNPAFVSELAGYRKQLAAPYLNDKKVTEALMTQAYDRMKTEINASHILINASPDASPADTLAAYNKILDLRKRILKGESFDSIASKYSDDPSAKKNLGKLGWFTVFQMVYPFEGVAYQTPKGEISMPFRTQFGYHILRVNDKRAARGEVKVKHIMIRTGYGTSVEQISMAKGLIDSANLLLKKGEPFENVVERFSQDDGSKGNKGVMNWIASLSGYPENFKDICFNLKQGETTEPFQTDFGYHIVSYVDKRPLGEYKDVQDIIKNKVSRDSRSEGSKAAVVERVKKEDHYKEFPMNLKAFSSQLDSSFLKGIWKMDSSKIADKPLFTIGANTYKTMEFASYLKENQKPHDKESAEMVARREFTEWANLKCLAYEESQLDRKYEDFRNIINEYHDGILLFDLTDRKVWSKALTDTVGLDVFFAGRRSKYMWKERLEYKVYTFVDAKTKAAAVKMFNAGKSENEVFAKINKKVAGSISGKTIRAEQNDATAATLWSKKGVVDIADEGGNFKCYFVNGTIPAEPKELKEAKGLVTSDYQEYLMENWIKELRAKYPVNVNKEALNGLYQ